MKAVTALFLVLLAAAPSDDVIHFPPDRRTDLSASVFVDQDGNACAIKDLDGKVVVVAFWTVWCPTCMQCVPELLALQQLPSLKDKVEIIPCNDDTDFWPSGVKQWAAANRKVLPSFRYFRAKRGRQNIKGQLSQRVDGYPTVLILDRHGRLATRWAGYAKGLLLDEINLVLAE